MAAHRDSRSHARLQDLTLGALDIYQLARWRLIHLARYIHASLPGWLMYTVHTYRDRTTRVRYSLILSSLPVGIFSIVAIHNHHTTVPLQPTLVETEGVSARRQDYNTFVARWYNSLPPSQVIREVHVEVPPLPSPAKTTDPAVPSARKKVVTRVVRDICQRHGMHKKYYGNRWRCRR